MPRSLKRTKLDESGATAVEYALMAALIAGVIFAAVVILGGSVSALFADAAVRI